MELPRSHAPSKVERETQDNSKHISHNDLVRFLQHCLKQWWITESSEIERATTKLQPEHPLASGARTGLGAARLAQALASDCRRLAEATTQAVQGASLEATGLEHFVSKDISVTCAELGSWSLAVPGHDLLERDIEQWWGSTMSKSAARASDLRESKAGGGASLLSDRLASALLASSSAPSSASPPLPLSSPSGDATTAQITTAAASAEIAGPWRQLLERSLLEEFLQRSREVAAQEFQRAFRGGAPAQLNRAVENAMVDAAALLANDPNMLSAVKRFGEATNSDSLIRAAVVDVSELARTIMRHIAQECAQGDLLSHLQPSLGDSGGAMASFTEELLGRARADTRPLGESLQSLSADVCSLCQELSELGVLSSDY